MGKADQFEVIRLIPFDGSEDRGSHDCLSGY
jgi:hypothetical protein